MKKLNIKKLIKITNKINKYKKENKKMKLN